MTEDNFILESLREHILARYESDEILEILGLDSDDLFNILQERILDNREKFDVPEALL